MLKTSILEGLALLGWREDAFAYAESFDESSTRYRGLRTGRFSSLPEGEGIGLLVLPELAATQMESEASSGTARPSGTQPPTGSSGIPLPEDEAGPPVQPSPSPKELPTRFHGTVVLDTARTGRDASRIADEVIAHLSGLVGANVTVTLEIEASIPAGAPEHVIRTVTENSRTLKFKSHGFEKD